jgi:hypothetical protein
MALVVEFLPSKCDALSSNPSIEKKKREREKRKREKNPNTYSEVGSLHIRQTGTYRHPAPPQEIKVVFLLSFPSITDTHLCPGVLEDKVCYCHLSSSS